MKKKVMVAMSGGVDSSTAAGILCEHGYEVTGVTMQIWPAGQDGGETDNDTGCCSLPAMRDAREVAEKLGITHYVFDFRDVFSERVIENFCNEYRVGRTPNPCIRCNQYVKFDTFLELAKSLGMDFIATGHYARIKFDSGMKRYLLKKGVDSGKDQSYVLYTMTQDQLAHTLMPLGGFTKSQIREKARELQLPVADRPESQEICFIPDNDYRKYLRDHVPEAIRPGCILNLAGEHLGEHEGVAFYTIGQRKGLGLAAARPYYIVSLNPERNEVTVGFEEDLRASAFVAADMNFIAIEKLAGPLSAGAKIRYNAAPAAATISPLGNDQVKVEFEQPQKAITPGQAVVFYDGDLVIGGGTIERVFC